MKSFLYLLCVFCLGFFILGTPKKEARQPLPEVHLTQPQDTLHVEENAFKKVDSLAEMVNKNVKYLKHKLNESNF